MKKISQNCYLFLLCGALSSFSLCAQGAVLVEDNFNGYSPVPESLPTGESPEIWKTTLTNANKTFTVVADTGNLFGQGTSNQFLNMAVTSYDTSLQPMAATNTFNSTQSGQISLDFYDPTGSTGDGWIMRWGTGNGNSTSAFALSIQDGSFYLYTGGSITKQDAVASYTQDTVNNLVVVFNNTGSALTYEGGTVASGMMDVWLNGTRVASGVSNTGNISTGTSLNSFNFVSKAQYVGSLYIDNLSIDSNASIPEPSESAAILLAATLLLAFLKRVKGRR
ncbi:hypothetical protein [Ruficoccus sp. ZRK36]|uniref:hypothetical protein n=1 Tax=Ruficoccus sp. ZRK36 TaxID=2866311 RepID=UPI001C738D13|nr:hypothetical protein [Ruficoccus sp. ZRK36]QYY34311.1 hypothetical protein K0V07_08265 [Ruficoccus sp. ZRK36]